VPLLYDHDELLAVSRDQQVVGTDRIIDFIV